MNLLEWRIGMMKSTDLTVGDALYLYTICPNLTDSSDFFPYKEALFLWFCIEPPRHAWRRPAIQQVAGQVIISIHQLQDISPRLHLVCCPISSFETFNLPPSEPEN
jgi:hypothetical protein